jgi:hypothetical protein
MSGYLEYNRGNEDFLEEGFFLQKPFSRVTLVGKVAEALRNNSPAESIQRSISWLGRLAQTVIALPFDARPNSSLG